MPVIELSSPVVAEATAERTFNEVWLHTLSVVATPDQMRDPRDHRSLPNVGRRQQGVALVGPPILWPSTICGPTARPTNCS